MHTRFHKAPMALAALAAVAAIAGCGGASNGSSTANATDRAFVQQMVPHHMMAVQMAQTAERQGGHPQTKTLAANITTGQQAEIAQMKTIAKQLGAKPDAMPMHGNMGHHMMADAQTLGISMDHMGMDMNMDSLNGTKPFDRAFIDMMIPHHQGAIRMARAELAKGKNPQLKTLAKAIIAAQSHEITQMNSWRRGWYGSTSPAGAIPA